MKLATSHRIAAAPAQVWAALDDPAVLARCIPGCEGVERLSPTEFAARVTVAVGPVKARFAGKVTLSDLDPPRACRISGEGQAGAVGFARGTAAVRLAEAEGGGATDLAYDVEAQVGGRLAQVGARLIDGVARNLAAEFFARLAAVLAETPPEAAAAREPAAEVVSAVVPPAGRTLVWLLAGLALLALAVTLLAGRP
jgi:carbon monoxide dehydrogenase subunit G